MVSRRRRGSSTTTSWPPHHAGRPRRRRPRHQREPSLIRRTRGGGWPTEAVTDEFNYVDLVWHELEFREADSFTYVVRDAAGGYLGCCYLYPMGRRAALTEELARYDVDVSWWVTPDAYANGHYTKLYLALRHWLAAEFPFWDPHYSNVEIPPE